MEFRTEEDFLGTVQISQDKYYGINTFRAIENFNIDDKYTDLSIIYALVTIKKAAAYANRHTGRLDNTIGNAIIEACDKIISGQYDNQFVTCHIQGGAGTSVNMNVNEVVANVALELLGNKKGEYHIIHPNDHVNMSQSTNDTYQTAVKIAAIRQLHSLSENFARLQEALQAKENEFGDILKIGRTQLQDAVPILLGQEFGAYAQAIARDRWRLYKSEERLRVINIGGTAIGTSINADASYIFYITEKLRELTGLGLSRSEYNIDTTQNCDAFVEVSGLLKTAAVNLCKIANDLRMLSSGPVGGIGEIALPKRQAGSSIMPGKVNPVIPELINQVSFVVMSNDLAITLAAQAGQLELNVMLPTIASKLLDSLKLLNNSITIFIDKCINDIKADKIRCQNLMEKSYCMSSALVPYIGYDKACEIAKECLKTNKSLIEVSKEKSGLTDDELEMIFNPYKMTSMSLSSVNTRRWADE